MTHRPFGWDYPPGVSSLPGEDTDPTWIARIAAIASATGLRLDPEEIEETTGALNIGTVGLRDAERLWLFKDATVGAVHELDDGRWDVHLCVPDMDDGEPVACVLRCAQVPEWAREGA